MKQQQYNGEKKYPEHYWRWQFYGKILIPDKVIPFTSNKQEVKNVRNK